MILAETFDWPALLERIGYPIASLIFILWAGYTKKWVWGYQLKESETREKDWKDLAFRGTLALEKQASQPTKTLEERIKDLEGKDSGG